MDTFRSSLTALTPELLEIIVGAWVDYVQVKVSKGLEESERPHHGQEREAWANLVSRFQSTDKAWKSECLKRDEKFDMHFSAAVRV